jgi:hypothetical protein
MTCPQCGSQQLSNAVVCLQCGNVLKVIEQTQQQKMIKKASIVILAGVLIAGIGYFFATIGRTYHPVIDHQPSIGYGIAPSKEKISSGSLNAMMDGNYIVIPSEKIMNYRIVRVNDPEGKQSIPILLYVTPRGKIVTAMSISESCRSNDFYLEGDNIHCANCPSYWNMESLEAYACCQKYYPEPIPSTVMNGMVRIDKKIVQEWRTRL